MIGMVVAPPPAGSRVEPWGHAPYPGPLHERWRAGFDACIDSAGRASAHGATLPPTWPLAAACDVRQEVVRACVGDERPPGPGATRSPCPATGHQRSPGEVG